MKFYETGLIFNPQLDEAGFDEEVRKVTDLIENNSGKVDKVDRWGLRRLAYEIKKKNQGHYAFVYYEAPPEVPRQIETMLRINENCMRFMTIVPDFRPEEKEEKPRPQARGVATGEPAQPREEARPQPAPEPVEEERPVEEEPQEAPESTETETTAESEQEEEKE